MPRSLIWKDVPDEDWYSWKWQIKNRINTLEGLVEILDLSSKEKEEIGECLSTFRMAITPYYASLIHPSDPTCPIRMQAVPSGKELREGVHDLDDPLKEDEDSPVAGLTHRYPDRVLLRSQTSVLCTAATVPGDALLGVQTRLCLRRRFKEP